MDGGGGWLGVPPTHVHTHARTCARVKHDNFMQMAAPIGGNPWEFPYDVIRVCACVCAHVWGAPSHHPPPPSTQPPYPQGGTSGISQNSIALELIEIFQFRFEDLKSVETSPPMGGCIFWWVVGWVDGWDQVKTLKI